MNMKRMTFLALAAISMTGCAAVNRARYEDGYAEMNHQLRVNNVHGYLDGAIHAIQDKIAEGEAKLAAYEKALSRAEDTQQIMRREIDDLKRNAAKPAEAPKPSAAPVVEVKK